MKVIVAGFSKTGTKTIAAALTKLGYIVYDHLEHFLYHGDLWMNIAEGKGKLEDFRKMYDSVDVVVDYPAFLFWHEIFDVFPDSKIILPIRDEKSWYDSLKIQMQQCNQESSTFLTILAGKLSPTARRFFRKHIPTFVPELSGMDVKVGRFYLRYPCNELAAKQKYRKHNAYVMQMAPKDKLLVYNVKDGWKPLCKFLNKEVPDESFPHRNIGGREVVIDTYSHPFANKVLKEVLIALAIIFAIIVLLFIYLSRMFPHTSLLTTIACGLAVMFVIL